MMNLRPLSESCDECFFNSEIVSDDMPVSVKQSALYRVNVRIDGNDKMGSMILYAL